MCVYIYIYILNYIYIYIYIVQSMYNLQGVREGVAGQDDLRHRRLTLHYVTFNYNML